MVDKVFGAPLADQMIAKAAREDRRSERAGRSTATEVMTLVEQKFVNIVCRALPACVCFWPECECREKASPSTVLCASTTYDEGVNPPSCGWPTCGCDKRDFNPAIRPVPPERSSAAEALIALENLSGNILFNVIPPETIAATTEAAAKHMRAMLETEGSSLQRGTGAEVRSTEPGPSSSPHPPAVRARRLNEQE